MSKEIKERIDKLCKEYDEIFDPSTFVLKPRLFEIETEIMQLQKKCTHHFINGQCEFCKMEEC